MSKQKKIAILLSHPIQYFSPLLKLLNKEVDIELIVYYCYNPKENSSFDNQFGKNVEWDMPLLEGYNYKFLKNYSIKPSVGMKFWGLINLGIIKELRKDKPDILLVHGWAYFTNIWAIFVARFFKIKVWLRTESPLNQELLKSRAKLFLRKLFFKIIFNKINKFLYIGTQNKSFYEFYGVKQNKLVFTPYAVDNDFYAQLYDKNIANKSLFRKEFNIATDSIVILFTGKYINKKRPLDLLKAYKNLSHSNKSLIMVGEGELRGEMENYIKQNNLKNVLLTGFINTSQIYKYYIAADIFVLPSQVGETWGLVTNEALNFALPVIISDMPGSGYDLVKDNFNGFSFKLGDIDFLESRLEFLFNNKEQLSILGQNSKVLIKQYSYSETIRGIKLAINHN